MSNQLNQPLSLQTLDVSKEVCVPPSLPVPNTIFQLAVLLAMAVAMQQQNQPHHPQNDNNNNNNTETVRQQRQQLSEKMSRASFLPWGAYHVWAYDVAVVIYPKATYNNTTQIFF